MDRWTGIPRQRFEFEIKTNRFRAIQKCSHFFVENLIKLFRIRLCLCCRFCVYIYGSLIRLSVRPRSGFCSLRGGKIFFLRPPFAQNTIKSRQKPFFVNHFYVACRLNALDRRRTSLREAYARLFMSILHPYRLLGVFEPKKTIVCLRLRFQTIFAHVLFSWRKNI